MPDNYDELVRYLSKLALVPRTKVKLSRAEPFGGPLTVRIGTSEDAISRELTEGIGVT